MLEIGWPELLLVAIITVLVFGPKELPRVLRAMTLWVRKARGLAREFQSGLDEMAREADLNDLKKNMTEVEHHISAMSIKEELDKALDPGDEVKELLSGNPVEADAVIGGGADIGSATSEERPGRAGAAGPDAAAAAADAAAEPPVNR